MYKFVAVLFNNTTNNESLKLFFAALFPFFTLLALGIDSVAFAKSYFDGRTLTNVLAITYFSLFFYASQSYLRKLMFCMVFLSYIGELLFCKLLGMYHYRTNFIPLYVPFGHAIVYASGFVLAESSFLMKRDAHFKKLFSFGFALLFLAVGILLRDVFSLIFGLLFFILMKRKKGQILYYTIALCVIFIELVGTYFKCWTWIPKTFNFIPAANPPMGAVFFYAGGDVILVKIVSLWKPNVQPS